MKLLNALAILALTLPLAPSAHAAWWKPILVCDGGAAVVSVDLGERRNVQFDLNNSQIVEYFLRNNGNSSALNFQNGHAYLGHRLDQGIFNSSQFRGFEANQANSPAVQIQRTGSGLYVRIVSLAHKECIDWRPNDFYCAETRDVPEVQYADWNFQHCDEQPANP